MVSQSLWLLTQTYAHTNTHMPDNTHCKLQMFWQQILQLGNAFVDSVTSFLFDQSVRQLVCLLERVEKAVSKILAAQSELTHAEISCILTFIYLALISLHAPSGFVHINGKISLERR